MNYNLSYKSYRCTQSTYSLTRNCLSSCSVTLCVPSGADQGCLVNILVDRSLTANLMNRRFNITGDDYIQLPGASIAPSSTVSFSSLSGQLDEFMKFLVKFSKMCDHDKITTPCK